MYKLKLISDQETKYVTEIIRKNRQKTAEISNIKFNHLCSERTWLPKKVKYVFFKIEINWAIS